MGDKGGGGQHAAVVGKDGRVAGCEIEGSGDSAAEEDGGAGLASVKIKPFFGLGGDISSVNVPVHADHVVARKRIPFTHIRVPVKLPKAFWLQRHDRSGNGSCDGEVARIDNGERAAATGRWWYFDL